MKKQLPLLIGFLAGSFAIAEFYIPAGIVRDIQSKLLEFASVLAAAAFVLGGINVIQVNLPIILHRRPDWQYKVVLMLGAAAMLLAGIEWHSLAAAPAPTQVTERPTGTTALAISASRDDAELSVDNKPFVPLGSGWREPVAPGAHNVAVRIPQPGYSAIAMPITVRAGMELTLRVPVRMLWGPSGRVYTWMYDHVFGPCNATMFALLSFFIASAAFRAFRARNLDAALLLGAAIIIMLGRVPIGRAIAGWLPALSDWIIDIPNNAGRRAIMMGAAIGAVATSLRVILGLERSHLGRD